MLRRSSYDNALFGGLLACATAAGLSLASCGAEQRELRPAAGPAAPRVYAGGAESAGQEGEQTYVAVLSPVNDDVAPGKPSGQVALVVEEGRLELHVRAKGLPPGMMHLQHIHGFKGPQSAACPTGDSDTNDDGFVDLLETEPISGVTLIPLHDDPESLQIKTDTYPTAENGVVTYRHEMPFSELKQALRQEYGLEPRFDRRVVYIHGVPESVELPDSVQSLPGVPAHMTLPIACGEFRRIQ